jgi:hypothetical protein
MQYAWIEHHRDEYTVNRMGSINHILEPRAVT